MNATVNRKALLEACGLAAEATPKKAVRQVLAHVRVVADGAGLFLTATDMEIGVRVNVPALEVRAPGVAVAPAAALTDGLRESRADEVELQAAGESLAVRGTGVEYELPLYHDPSEFPDWPAVREEDGCYEVAAEALCRDLTRTAFCAAGANVRYAMSGVLVEPRAGGGLRLVATDGKGLAYADLGGSQPVPVARPAAAVIPSKAATALARLCKKEGGQVRVMVRPNEAVFAAPSFALYTRLVEGHYPRYEDVLKAKMPEARNSFRAQARDVLTALRQASVMSTEAGFRRVTLTFAPGKMTAQASGDSRGRSKAEAAIAYDGPQAAVAVNASLPAEMLALARPEQEFEVRFGGAETPLMFLDGGDYFYCVMPIT